MYHEITILGRCTKDPVSRFTPAGKEVCELNVAVDDGYGDSKKTIWVKITAWEQLATACNNNLHKGSLIFAKCRLHHENGNPRVWESNGKHGASFELTANTVKFLTPKDHSPEAGNMVDEF